MIRLTSTLLIFCALAACGGGGGGSSTSSSGGNNNDASGGGGGVPVAAVDKTSPTVGDYYTYKMTGYNISNGNNQYTYQPAYETELTTAVAGNIATIKTLHGDQLLGWFDGRATLKAINQIKGESSCTTTYAPGIYGPPATLGLNVSWENSTSYTSDCGPNIALRSGKLTSKGTVVAIESITVAAGTFQAYKLTAIINDQRSDNRVVGMINSPVASLSVSKLTAWIDIDTGIEIKRSIEEAVTGFLDTYVYTLNREMVGVSHAKSGRQVLVVERFVSPSWKASYSGQLSGTCNTFIFEGEAIYARCPQGTSTTAIFDRNGTINNSGQISYSLPAGAGNNITFTGKAESLTKMSGTWRDNAGATGTWLMNRDN